MSETLRYTMQQYALNNGINYQKLVERAQDLSTAMTCCECGTKTSITLGVNYNTLACKNVDCAHSNCSSCAFDSRALAEVNEYFVVLKDQREAIAYGGFCCNCGDLNAVDASFWAPTKLWFINFLTRECKSCGTAYCKECRRVKRIVRPIQKKSQRKRVREVRRRLAKIRRGELSSTPLRQSHTPSTMCNETGAPMMSGSPSRKRLRSKVDIIASLGQGGSDDKATKRRRTDGPATNEDKNDGAASIESGPPKNGKRKADGSSHEGNAGDEHSSSKDGSNDMAAEGRQFNGPAMDKDYGNDTGASKRLGSQSRLKRKADDTCHGSGSGTERAARRRRFEELTNGNGNENNDDDDDGAPTKPDPPTNKLRKANDLSQNGDTGDENSPVRRSLASPFADHEKGALADSSKPAHTSLKRKAVDSNHEDDVGDENAPKRRHLEISAAGVSANATTQLWASLLARLWSAVTTPVRARTAKPGRSFGVNHDPRP